METDVADDKLRCLLGQLEESYNGVFTNVQKLADQTSDWSLDLTEQVSSELKLAANLGTEAVAVFGKMSAEQKKSSEFRQRHEAICTLIQKTLTILNQLEASALSAKEELAPIVSHEVQVMRMRSAYKS